MSSYKPKFYPGDRVRALNYRRKPGIWEAATVLDTETRWDNRAQYRHRYRLRLDRPGPIGPLFITVGDDTIAKY